MLSETVLGPFPNFGSSSFFYHFLAVLAHVLAVGNQTVWSLFCSFLALDPISYPYEATALAKSDPPFFLLKTIGLEEVALQNSFLDCCVLLFVACCLFLLFFCRLQCTTCCKKGCFDVVQEAARPTRGLIFKRLGECLDSGCRGKWTQGVRGAPCDHISICL